MAGRSHLSIGEVLSLLQDEFPDVTISKIRFLESQGLVDPERTPSGYRKFYEEDIERLRWVLRQQRDAFLPLKVIRGRLEGQESLPLGDVVAGDGQERPVAAGVGEGVGEPARERAGALLASNAQGPAGRGRKVAVGPIEVGPIGAGQT
ncbi:MAG: MerR family transcriptional regulator, partial [Acidimicrobiales bacterium]